MVTEKIFVNVPVLFYPIPIGVPGLFGNQKKKLYREYAIKKFMFTSKHQKLLKKGTILRVRCVEGIEVLQNPETSETRRKTLPQNRTIMFCNIACIFGQGIFLVLNDGENWLFKVSKPRSTMLNWNEIRKLRIFEIVVPDQEYLLSM